MNAKISSKINDIKTACYSDFTCTSLGLEQMISGQLKECLFFSQAVSTPGQKTLNIKRKYTEMVRLTSKQRLSEMWSF